MNRKIRRFEQAGKRILIKLMRSVLPDLAQKNGIDADVRNLAILAQEKLGDTILLTPLLARLKEARPDLELTIVAFSDISFEFFSQDAHVDQVYKAKGQLVAYLKAVRSRQFDLLFCTKDHPSFTFLLHSRLLRARHRVGIDHPQHRGYFDHLITMNWDSHIIEKNCALLELLDIAYDKADCRPYLPPSALSSELQSFLPRLDESEVIGINLSAGAPSREWPLARYQALMEHLSGPVVILAMPARRQEKRQLEQAFDQVLPSPDTQTIYEAGQIIRRLKLLITPDTAMVHVAACYGIGVIALYRRDEVHLSRFAPYGIPSRQLISSTSTIADISVNQVFESISDMLEIRTDKGP